MTNDEYRLLRQNFPFPWRQQVYQDRRGGVVRLIAANGAEVPLFTMCAFIEHVTARFAQGTEASPRPFNPSTGSPS